MGGDVFVGRRECGLEVVGGRYGKGNLAWK